MQSTVILDYPWWWAGLCIIGGLFFGWLAYRHTSFSSGGRQWGWPTWAMAALRGLLIAILLFFLLGPVLKLVDKNLEKPIAALLVDNSQSVVAGKDSAAEARRITEIVNNLANGLSEKFNVKMVLFGDKASGGAKPDFSQSSTNLAAGFDEVFNQFYNQNLGAVIAISDGISNSGADPLSASARLSAPIYAVALGDTTPKRDAFIRDAKTNAISYLGNSFPVLVQFGARGYLGGNAQLSISRKGKSLAVQNIALQADNFASEATFFIKADAPGIQKYTITLSPQSGEATLKNNAFDIYVEVLDARKKVLIIGSVPHPDIGAIKGIIERSELYEVTVGTISELAAANALTAEKLKSFGLVILHGLPAQTAGSAQLMAALDAQPISQFYFLSTSANFNQLSGINGGLSLRPSGGRVSDVGSYVNSSFAPFNLPDGINDLLPFLPPITAPFGDYSVADRSGIALLQTVGAVKSPMPLLMFGRKINGTKVGFFTGEGIFRWLPVAASKGKSSIVEELIAKSVQYLSLQADNRLFRLKPSKNLYSDEERITFDAEVYNQNYEADTGAEISLQLTSSTGKKFDYKLQPSGRRYSIDIGTLPAGEYAYAAVALARGKRYTASGAFSVQTIELEYIQTVADHALLRSISNASGGQLLLPGEAELIIEQLNASQQFAPTSYLETAYRALIELKWLFFLVLSIAAAEWFMSRWFGSY